MTTKNQPPATKPQAAPKRPQAIQPQAAPKRPQAIQPQAASKQSQTAQPHPQIVHLHPKPGRLLIVGLGNPGGQYNFTRHNFGFLALDFYFKLRGLSWATQLKSNAIYQKTDRAFFLKPQNFYNNSGESVQAFLSYYKIPLENLLVICDDFSIPFGTLRFREHGSAGGNNGLASIISHLHTDAFARLRLGTDNPTVRERLNDTDFVLARFTPDERDQLPAVLKQVTSELDALLA